MQSQQADICGARRTPMQDLPLEDFPAAFISPRHVRLVFYCCCSFSSLTLSHGAVLLRSLSNALCLYRPRLPSPFLCPLLSRLSSQPSLPPREDGRQRLERQFLRLRALPIRPVTGGGGDIRRSIRPGLVLAYVPAPAHADVVFHPLLYWRIFRVHRVYRASHRVPGNTGLDRRGVCTAIRSHPRGAGALRREHLHGIGTHHPSDGWGRAFDHQTAMAHQDLRGRRYCFVPAPRKRRRSHGRSKRPQRHDDRREHHHRRPSDPNHLLLLLRHCQRHLPRPHAQMPDLQGPSPAKRHTRQRRWRHARVDKTPGRPIRRQRARSNPIRVPAGRVRAGQRRLPDLARGVPVPV